MPWALLVALIALVFGHATYVAVAAPEGDFRRHMQFAEQLAHTGSLPFPHAAYHLMVLAVARLMPLAAASWLVALCFYELLGALVCVLVRRAFPDGAGARARWLPVALTLGLMVAFPISVFSLPRLYLGYIPPNVYHNPTVIVLKPLALALFVLTVRALKGSSRRPWAVPATAALVVVSTFVKPNYTLALVPTLMVVGPCLVLRRRAVDRWLLVAGVLGPAVVTLAYQYLAAFGAEDSVSHVVFAPLRAMTVYSSAGTLPLKFLASIVFPLTVYVVYRPRARRSLALNLAWLVFLVASAQVYLFAETGERLRALNFLWGPEVAVFILFVVSMVVTIRETWPGVDGRGPGWRLSWIAFGLQVASGVLYYGVHVGSQRFSDWW